MIYWPFFLCVLYGVWLMSVCSEDQSGHRRFETYQVYVGDQYAVTRKSLGLASQYLVDRKLPQSVHQEIWQITERGDKRVLNNFEDPRYSPSQRRSLFC